MDFIRSLFLRFHILSKRTKWFRTHHAVGCTGRLRGLSIPTLSSLRSVREKPMAQGRGARRRRKRKNDKCHHICTTEVITNVGGIPCEEEEFANFTAVHPSYLETFVVDELRDEEYGDLQEDGLVCLDYSGYGLFSQLQQELDSSSSSFAVNHIPGNLSVETLSARPTEGTVEFDIRRRIMRFLNIQEEEYGMVFTSSKSSAFTLLSESYPFDSQKRLLTIYDYESEAVMAMQETARNHGARCYSASFSFPSLSICSPHLKHQILCAYGEDNNEDVEIMNVHQDRLKGKKNKKKPKDRSDGHGECSKSALKQSPKGLFIFPVQSRVSGTRYSYQWMSLAQDNGWHVLLDASALGPKDMDSLGLSLFRPDFIITSFYKVFGSDPTGFGCLFVKNSSMSILRQSMASRNTGMVRLVPLPDASSPDNLTRTEPLDAVSGERNKNRQVSLVTTSQEPMQAQVAFSGPSSTFFMWKAPNKNADAVERDSCMMKNEENPVIQMIDCNHNDAECHDRSTTRGCTEELKNSVPVTPRSVLEESPLGGLGRSNDGESHELDQDGGIHRNLSKLGSKNDLVFGKPLDNKTLSQVETLKRFPESTQPTSCNVLNKKDFIYYSHEIACQGSSSKCKVAFSQPLISRDIRENPFLVNSEGSSFYDELDFSSSLYDDDDDDDDDDDEEESSEWDNEGDPFQMRRIEPEIYCRGLNHADALGLNKTNDRLRFLTNWLITSMMKLHHLVSNHFEPLVHLYGPKAKSERGASLAFNLFDQNGGLLNPTLVRELARSYNISLGLGVLSQIKLPEGYVNVQTMVSDGEPGSPVPQMDKCRSLVEIRVVTATLGFFTNFEDVYKLWTFVAKFLDAEFVEHNLHCDIPEH